MATLTIRNLDDELVADLKRQAQANNRSLEGEVRALLESRRGRKSKAQLVEEARQIAKLTGAQPGDDSTELIREDRDRDRYREDGDR
jgi:plasmid stability protein